MTEYFGTFKERGNLRPGALYAKKFKSRHRGDGSNAAFKAGIPKQRVEDAHYASTRVGDPYTESRKGAGGPDGEEGGGEAPAAANSKPFKPASPMKSSAPQSGDTAVTFQGRVAYETPYTPDTGEKREVKHQARGIYTNPAKMGGFGYNKVTLSERRGYKGAVGEYEHLSDPVREVTRAPPKENSRQPFKSGGGVRCEAFSLPEYTPQGPREVVKSPQPTVPFRPTFAGATLRFGAAPEYMLQPPTPPSKEKPPEVKPWKSPKSEISDAFRSIVRMNV